MNNNGGEISKLKPKKVLLNLFFICHSELVSESHGEYFTRIKTLSIQKINKNDTRKSIFNKGIRQLSL